MKAAIHPQYHTDTQVVCSCGNKFVTGSTIGHITVDICNKCHPFYTGEQKFLDRKGRVDTFQKKQKAAKIYQASIAGKKKNKQDNEEKKTKSLRELLGEM